MQRIGWMTSSVAINGSGVKRFTVWMRCMFGRQFPVWWARFMHDSERWRDEYLRDVWWKRLNSHSLVLESNSSPTRPLEPAACSQNMTLAFYWGEVIKYRTIILAVFYWSHQLAILLGVWCNIFYIVWKHMPWKHIVKAINYVNLSFYTDSEKCRATRHFVSHNFCRIVLLSYTQRENTISSNKIHII